MGQASFAAFKNLASTEPEFRSALYAMATELNINPDFIAGVMAFESGFNPAAKNPYSSASGLIQWMESTARRYGTTTAAIRSMSRMEQLPLVKQYFQPWAGKIRTPEDAYLTVFYPCAIGKASSWIVASNNPSAHGHCAGVSDAQNLKEYDQNKRVFDPSGRGYYTKGDITRTFMSQYNAAQSKDRIPVDDVPASDFDLSDNGVASKQARMSGAGITLIAAAAGWLAVDYWRKHRKS